MKGLLVEVEVGCWDRCCQSPSTAGKQIEARQINSEDSCTKGLTLHRQMVVVRHFVTLQLDSVCGHMGTGRERLGAPISIVSNVAVFVGTPAGVA